MSGYESPEEEKEADSADSEQYDNAEGDSDAHSTSSTISTPDDDEIDNMSPVGTLRHDGTLGPPTAAYVSSEAEQAPPSSSSSSNQICDTGQTPSTCSLNVNQSAHRANQYENVVLKTDQTSSNDQITSSASNQNPPQTPAAVAQSDAKPNKPTEKSGEKFYTPLLRFKKNSKKHITQRKKRAGTKHRISPSKTSPGKKPAITNPTYEQFTFEHTVSGINVSGTPASQRAGSATGPHEESIYETPCAVLGPGMLNALILQLLFCADSISIFN